MRQMTKEQTTDEVIRETRRIKVALAKAMDFDIDRILKDAKQKQNKSARTILAPPVRRDI